MPVQYPYPERSWSTGKMRKRGQRPEGEFDVALDWARRGRPESALAEMDRAAGMGIAARGGPTGTFQAPGAIPMAKISNEAISEQRAQLQEGMNQLATGDMTMGVFRKLMKRLGWMGSPEDGKFTDPIGQEHIIPLREAGAQ